MYKRQALAGELRKRDGIDSVKLITADAAVAELGEDPVFALSLIHISEPTRPY